MQLSDEQKQDIQKRIEGFKAQQEQLLANLNACAGAIKALESLLEEPKDNPE